MIHPSHPEESSPTKVLRRKTEYKPRPSLITWLIGRPLPTADAPHQTIGKAIGLAVFASDALSSTAYATQEILVILAAAGSVAFGYAFPISVAIVSLLVIVAISYEQTIHAYPGGGGAYIVSRDNLGELPAQIAGSALLTDYILTVSVSISAGVAQIVSAFPNLQPYAVWIAIGMVGLIMVINLRGVKESGIVFAIPTYFFIFMMFATLGFGILQKLTGVLGNVPAHEFEQPEELAPITAFLILHAFSSGTAALTGIEAISNGITAFKEPRSKNAGITLIWMAVILSTLFLGITYLAGQIGAYPSEIETVISQLGSVIYGDGSFLYLALIAATTIILIMAANTAFADFPRLAALLALDGFLPRQMAFRGSRLAFSYGIVTLAGFASLLIFIFKANVSSLIPLYAIGVFLSFTLSQFGMALRWHKIGKMQPGQEIREAGSVLHYDRNWYAKMFINGFGALCTAIVMVVFAITKFVDGAWVVLIVIPTVVILFNGIHRHYTGLASKLSLESYGAPPRVARHRVVMLVSGVHRGTLSALRYARTLSDDVTALHVSLDPESSQKILEKWHKWGDGVRLVVLDSPYRLLVEPIIEYINDLDAKRQPNEIITVIVPEFVPGKIWHNLLHAQAAWWLRLALRDKAGIVITDVPYQVE